MKYITIYLDAVAARGCVAGTVKLYREELRRADRFFTARAIADEKAITERDILDYLEYLKACLSPHQYYKEVTGLKRYLLFCEARGLIFYSPMADIESPKRVRLTKPIFQQEEITAILGRIGSDNDADIRNHAMLMVGYSSTLRPGEVTRLKLQDIDWSNRLLFIEQSKNRKRPYRAGRTGGTGRGREVSGGCPTEIHSAGDPFHTVYYHAPWSSHGSTYLSAESASDIAAVQHSTILPRPDAALRGHAPPAEWGKHDPYSETARPFHHHHHRGVPPHRGAGC
jgi:hypothetical protein